MAVLLGTSGAAAQGAPATGFLTAQAGVSSGGEVRNRGSVLGTSLIAVESNGIGAELDLGHLRSFDTDRFAQSGVTTLTVGPTWVRPHPVFRPYVSVGAGLLRVRAEDAGSALVVNRTDWGMAAGGGVIYLLNDAVGVRGELRYQRLFQRHDDVPLIDNGFFDYWRTSIGVVFAWPLR